MIELKDVTYKIEDNGQEKIILDNISCIFEDNKKIAITGHNGSGKSTLTKLIIGIIKPTSGKIYFNGKDITDLPINERADLGISYAFQQPITFTGLTIKDLIDIASKEKNTIPKACEYLSVVGICAKEYIDRNFDKTLSGGEQKRIELALALARKGDFYIFDEPEAGIDMWSFEKLNKMFRDNKSYIVVSHQEKVLKNADKIMVLNNGKIVSYGDAKVIMPTLKNGFCARIGGGN